LRSYGLCLCRFSDCDDGLSDFYVPSDGQVEGKARVVVALVSIRCLADVKIRVVMRWHCRADAVENENWKAHKIEEARNIIKCSLMC
jgi:hypothetical protein